MTDDQPRPPGPERPHRPHARARGPPRGIPRGRCRRSRRSRLTKASPRRTLRSARSGCVPAAREWPPTARARTRAPARGRTRRRRARRPPCSRNDASARAAGAAPPRLLARGWWRARPTLRLRSSRSPARAVPRVPRRRPQRAARDATVLRPAIARSSVHRPRATQGAARPGRSPAHPADVRHRARARIRWHRIGRHRSRPRARRRLGIQSPVLRARDEGNTAPGAGRVAPARRRPPARRSRGSSRGAETLATMRGPDSTGALCDAAASVSTEAASRRRT